MNEESANNEDYKNAYEEESFWSKISNQALKAGKEVVEKALTLYYTFIDTDTPAWAQSIIVGALGYFISPIDAIPDITPVVGYADDLGVLAAALATVAAHVKEEHIAKAKETMTQWFG